MRSYRVPVIALAPAAIAAAQCQWLPADGTTFAPINTNTAIAAWDPDGAGPLGPCVTVGSFGGNTDPGAYWDGLAWRVFQMGTHPPIWSMCTYTGDLICAGPSGLHSYGGGSVTAPIARFDGARWWPVGSGGPTAAILSVCEWNGSLFTAAGLTSGGLARWDGNVWTTLPDPPGIQTPRAWGVHNGQLIVAGAGTTRVATWDGAAWTSWPVTPPLPEIECIASWNGKLLVAGSQVVFAYDGVAWQQMPGSNTKALLSLGTTLYSIAPSVVSRWNPSQGWLPIGPGLNGGVTTIATGPAGTFIGGGFSLGGGYAQLLGVARYVNGTLQPVGVSSPNTNAIAVGDPDLYLATGATVLHNDGGTWYMLPQLSSTVRALMLDSNSLIAGGEFTAAIRRWTGALWEPLGGGITYSQGTAKVEVLARHGTDLYAGGRFDGAGGVPAGNIARWDGQAWHALPGSVNDTVLAMATYNGDLIIGGAFTVAAAGLASHVVRWDGQAFHAMGNGFTGTVNALAVHGGTLYAGGLFNASGLTTLNHIARWDGQAWRPMGVGVNTGSVEVLASVGDELLAGGWFTVVNAQPTAYLAHWGCACYANCDGSTIAPLLNVQDFSCFLNRFASGEAYANCDGSTVPPVLNIQDFSCFLNRFAVGCS